MGWRTMLGTKSYLATLIQSILVGYLLVSVIYTTGFILAAPLSYIVPSIFGIELSIANSGSGVRQTVTPRVDLVAHAYKVLAARQRSQAKVDSGLSDKSSGSWDLESDNDWLYWNALDLNSVNNLPGIYSEIGDVIPIREETFLSKAFAQAMHPTDIIPFYYKATGLIDEEDVTITTLVTSNRYKVLKQLVERYKGVNCVLRLPYWALYVAIPQVPSL